MVRADGRATMIRRVVRRGRLSAVGIGITLLALPACGPPPPPPVLVGETSPAADLIRALDDRVARLGTVRAGAEMIWRDPHFGDEESCRGSLSWQEPSSMRLRGVSAAFFTVFDLTVRDREVLLQIPREDVAVFGSPADPAWDRLPLSPERLRVALLVHPCPSGDCLTGARRERVDGNDRLRGEFGEMSLDPATGLPLSFVASSEPPFRVDWSDWTEVGGVAWPMRTVIVQEGGESLEVRWGRVRIGGDVPSSRFEIEPDSSQEILTPADAARRWER